MYDGYLHAHFSTLGTTVVRPHAGLLHALVLNQRGSNNSRVILRDGAAVIADVTTGNTAPIGDIVYDAHFHANLTVERVGGSAPDITVLFR